MIVSFSDYRPTPRYDNTSWTHALIQEAVAPVGPWTQIDDIALAADPDPTNPILRSFTTHNAMEQEGLWYRVIFTDTAGHDQLATTPIQNINDTIDSVRPTIAQVGALLRARTVDDAGVRQGTFTPDTEPTDVEVSMLIDQAVRDVSMVAGADIPDVLAGQARDLAALRAAVYVENSYYPEQVAANASVASSYETIWTTAIGTPANPGLFVRSVQEAVTDDSLDVSGDVESPAFNFPNTVRSSMDEVM